MTLMPYDQQPLLEPIDQNITITIDMQSRPDGRVHWMFNDEAYQVPTLPTLFSALNPSTNATSPQTYGVSTQTFVLPHNAIIELSLHNKHMWKHPIHLHGHNFQVVHRTRGGAGSIEDTPLDQAPLRRDTAVINSHGDLRVRFRADNPGVWLLHCHMEWHAHSGLKATLVEAPLVLQQQLAGTVMQLAPNPARACLSADAAAAAAAPEDAEAVPVPSARVEQEAEAETEETKEGVDFNSLATPVRYAVLVISVVLVGIGLSSYVWYSRKNARSATYAPLPMADADLYNNEVSRLRQRPGPER
jgi:iron transport multicopper oxidase